MQRIGALLTWERAGSCQALGETLADGPHLIDPPREGDLLIEAAGRPLRSPDALRAIAQRQPPGGRSPASTASRS